MVFLNKLLNTDKLQNTSEARFSYALTHV